MEDPKNEAIPMGGTTADGASVSVRGKGEISPLPQGGEPSKKKNHVIVFVILGIAALLIAAAVALGVLFVFATTDTMPKAPQVTADMSTVIKDSALEMIKEKKITFDSDEINLFLKTLAEKSEDKLEENGMRLNDLFAVVNDDKATIYCRMNYKGVTWPIRATADVSYDDPYIVINLHSASIGKIDLPEKKLMEYFVKVANIEDISIHNNFIYYDTTNFNDKISQVALTELGLTIEDVQGDSTDEDKDSGFSIKKWWDNLFKGVSDSIKNWAAKVVSDFIHNIKFQDVKIIDNELVIRVTFDEEAPSDSQAVNGDSPSVSE